MTHWSDETCWQSLAEIAAKLKSRAEEAYWAGDDSKADTAHEDLVAVEHRMRMAERGRR